MSIVFPLNPMFRRRPVERRQSARDSPTAYGTPVFRDLLIVTGASGANKFAPRYTLARSFLAVKNPLTDPLPLWERN